MTYKINRNSSQLTLGSTTNQDVSASSNKAPNEEDQPAPIRENLIDQRLADRKGQLEAERGYQLLTSGSAPSLFERASGGAAGFGAVFNSTRQIKGGNQFLDL